MTTATERAAAAKQAREQLEKSVPREVWTDSPVTNETSAAAWARWRALVEIEAQADDGSVTHITADLDQQPLTVPDDREQGASERAGRIHVNRMQRG